MPLLSRDNLTVVAAVDPTARKMIEELEFLVQGRVIATLGDELQIKQKIRETYEKFGLHRQCPERRLARLLGAMTWNNRVPGNCWSRWSIATRTGMPSED